MKIRLVVVGFGTVGQGFAGLLLQKEKILREQYNLEPVVVAISDVKYGVAVDAGGLELSQVLQAATSGLKFEATGIPVQEISSDEVLEQVEYDVLVELTPTNLDTGEPALSFIRQALETGHHAITTNKGPCALHLTDLLEIARKKNVHFRYEGTVLAGTPLLNLVENGLAGLEIHKVEGIVNGTCNYILTQMEQGMGYQEALRKAQELGYAEANPEADVEGWDAVAKVMILSQALFHHKIGKDEVEREGITSISPADVEAAQNARESWKLIASLEKQGEKIIASVKPQRVPHSHPLAGVKGATNAVTLTTDYLHQVTIVGPGAGKHETGYAVLNDLISIHKKIA